MCVYVRVARVFVYVDDYMSFVRQGVSDLI